MEHLTITMDPEPQVVQLATIGLPGPKLRYKDLTENDKEDLRKGIYEAIDVQVKAAEAAEEGAEDARDVSLQTMDNIQNNFLPAITKLFNDTDAAKEDAEDARDASQAAQSQSELQAQASAASAQQSNNYSVTSKNARDGAVQAKNGADASAAAASISEKNAKDSEVTAEQHKDDAATQANASASSASQSATSASQSATSASESQKYAEQARKAVETSVQSLGVWAPSGSQEYPAAPTRDSRWTLKVPQGGYTFTSGDLSGELGVDGDTLFYDATASTFDLLATGTAVLGNTVQSITAADGTVYDDSNINLDADFVDAVSKKNGGQFDGEVVFDAGARLASLKSPSGYDVVSIGTNTANLGDTTMKTNIKASANPTVQVGTQGAREIYHKGNKPTPAEIGALDATYKPPFNSIVGLPQYFPTEWAQVASKPPSATRWPSFDEVANKPDVATRWPEFSEVTNPPDTATRWPTFNEVTNKPLYATRWPAFGEVTGKPSTATRWPMFSEVTDRPTHYPTNWDNVDGKPEEATRWPTPTEVGAEPALSPEQKRNIYMNSGVPDAAIGTNGDLYIET